MKLELVSLALVSTLALSGCDEAGSGTCDVVVADGFRGKSLNGKSLNGKSLNGVSFEDIVLGGDARVGGDELAQVELVGTALVGTTATGKRVAGENWIGAVIPASLDDEMLGLRIADVVPDAVDATIEWYVLEYEGEPVCEDGGRGMFMAGVWDDTGARHDALAGAQDVAYTFSCDTGVLAKCIDWGYAPYTAGIAAHQTCTRLARADYCGNGEPHTVDGTVIDVFDTLGVMEPDMSLDFAFEAGWGPDGAVCVANPRYVELASNGDEIAVPCWDELPACDTSDEAVATGATLMNRSAPQTLCHE